MVDFLKFVHTRLNLRGREVAAVYMKHGITEFDVERVNAEMERASKDPAFEPRYSEWTRVGNAFQKVMCELQEKGLADVEPARARSR